MKKYGILLLVLSVFIPGAYAQGPLKRAVKAASDKMMQKEKDVLRKVVGAERTPYLRVKVAGSGAMVDEKAAEAIRRLAESAKVYAASASAVCRADAGYNVFLDKYVFGSASSRGDWQAAQRALFPSRRTDSMYPVVYLNVAGFTGNEAEALALNFISRTKANVYIVAQKGPAVTVVSPSVRRSEAVKVFLKQGVGRMAYDVNERSLSWKPKYWWGLETQLLKGAESARVLRNIFYSAQTRGGLPENPFQSISNPKVLAKLRKEYIKTGPETGNAVNVLNANLPGHVAEVFSFIEQNDPGALILVISSEIGSVTAPDIPGRVAKLLGGRFPGSRLVSVVSYPALLSPKPSAKRWNTSSMVSEQTLTQFATDPTARLFQEAPNRHFAYEAGFDVRVIVHKQK